MNNLQLDVLSNYEKKINSIHIVPEIAQCETSQICENIETYNIPEQNNSLNRKCIYLTRQNMNNNFTSYVNELNNRLSKFNVLIVNEKYQT